MVACPGVSPPANLTHKLSLSFSISRPPSPLLSLPTQIANISRRPSAIRAGVVGGHDTIPASLLITAVFFSHHDFTPASTFLPEPPNTPDFAIAGLPSASITTAGTYPRSLRCRSLLV